VADTPVMPKGRYKIMKEYMPKRGTRGLDMMFRTCTIQVGGLYTFHAVDDRMQRFPPRHDAFYEDDA
jgi:glutamate--cysteine ligase